MAFSKSTPIIQTSAEFYEIVSIVPVSNRETWEPLSSVLVVTTPTTSSVVQGTCAHVTSIAVIKGAGSSQNGVLFTEKRLSVTGDET